MTGAHTVIIGAGAAGSVLAARLTERNDCSVMLLEAGPDYPDPRELPDDLRNGGRNSMIEHDWGFRHRPHKAQRLFRLPRGRVVGGSSAVNTCIALRGQAYDYDEWASLGLSEWSWDKCLPAFIKLENDHDFRASYHGQEGPLPLRRAKPEECTPWQTAFVEACKELGFPDCPDSNAPGSHGVGPHAMNKINGRRISAAEAYLTPEVRAREALSIRSGVTVRRVLFEGQRAIGVEVESKGGIEVIFAERVILCAGAIGSPGVLLRSGIGPGSELSRLGISLVAENPAVGSRLLDHPGTAIFFAPRLRARTSRHHHLIQNVLRYGSRGSGFLNDMLLQPGSTGPLPQFNIPVVSLMCGVGKVRAVGRITFSSASPHAKPHIDSNLFGHPDDRRKGVEGLQLAYELFHTSAMRRIARHFLPLPWTFRSRDRIEAWMMKACDSGYHPCGSVPMGPSMSQTAAADGRGQVFGVQGLYVADASLIPTVPSSNIHLPTLMMAERLAGWHCENAPV